METAEEQKPRVVVIDSLQSWEFYVNQASTQNSPIVVHFTASWCMPSVAMNPFFEELASTYPDVLFLTVDVDEVMVINLLLLLFINLSNLILCFALICLLPNTMIICDMYSTKSTWTVTEVAKRMDVKAMPTFVVVKDGAPLEKVVGANPEEIKKRIDTFVQSIRDSVA
ncbi:hypothetical protein Ahy_A10g050952 isoform A [Arachis hypogaea]|uniref:Thioredoxin domain-containing protein n=1 Tax=Arachis hypogaea TaxID=3818 RepID=A0A445BAY6_ARAHY|nr:hypothetical protein Ahy_A10g050952 isoform A [Arachis hypogaea]